LNTRRTGDTTYSTKDFPDIPGVSCSNPASDERAPATRPTAAGPRRHHRL